MPKEDEGKFVLRRGMAEHDWYTPSDYAPPAPKEGFRWRMPEVEISAPTVEQAERWAPRFKLAALVLVVVALSLLTLQMSVKGFEARGVSMEPTLHEGDRIIVNRLAYSQVDFGLLDWAPVIDPGGHWNTPSRGDIVVFKSPADGKELVKRVIGLPGETVEIKRGHVFVGDKELIEPYANGATECYDECVFTVPDGHYFVLGDNRGDSRDSREGWTVPLGNIDGQKLVTY
jgi:signal peptidase I